MNTKPLKQCEVAVLGVGAVGRSLSKAIVRGGLVRSVRVWARVEEAAMGLRDDLRLELEASGAGRLEIRALGDLEDTISGADVVLFCVVDDALEELATRVGAAYPAVEAGAVALHLSGFVKTEVLEPLAELDFETGGLHPLISLAGAIRPTPEALSPFAGAHFALAGSALARERARELVLALGGIPFELAAHESARALYHGAASLLAGGTVALFAAAERMLAGAIEAEPAVRRAALLGLLQSTVRNLEAVAPEDALTGPIRRGDRATVAGHLEALGVLGSVSSATTGAPASRVETLYRELSLAMLDLARSRADVDPATLDSLAALLTSAPQNT